MKTIVCFLIFIILLSGQLVYAEDVKVGFVDFKRVFDESDSGKKINSEFEVLKNAIKEKEKESDEIQKEIEEIIKKIAQEDGYTLIIDNIIKNDMVLYDMVLYSKISKKDSYKKFFSTKSDITETVIKRYNESKKQLKK